MARLHCHKKTDSAGGAEEDLVLVFKGREKPSDLMDCLPEIGKQKFVVSSVDLNKGILVWLFPKKVTDSKSDHKSQAGRFRI